MSVQGNCHKEESRTPLSLKELQDVELGILKSFRDFCDKNNLRYYLCNGTLIGAIRHKGFIPWDDDIDVMMPRPDYDRFLELNKEKKMLDEYRKIDDMNLNSNALSQILRIYDARTEVYFKNLTFNKDFGCWIDVFPLDGMSSSPIKRFFHCKWVRIIRDLNIACDTKLGEKRRTKLLTVLQYITVLILPFVRLVGHERWIALVDKLSRKYDYNKSQYVGVIAGIAAHKEAMLKNNMEPEIYVDFEEDKFMAMANFDEYLKNLYGDYMTPPDDAGKVSRHTIDVYWREDSK